jgi:hypothetical protein
MVQGIFSGYLKYNQPHCYGTFKYLDSVFNEDNFTYQGEIQGGLAHGQGVLINGANDRYVGNFENGKLNGPVQIFSSSGSLIFEGDFKAGK